MCGLYVSQASPVVLGISTMVYCTASCVLNYCMDPVHVPASHHLVDMCTTIAFCKHSNCAKLAWHSVMPCLRVHMGCVCSEAITALLSTALRTGEEKARHSEEDRVPHPTKPFCW